MIQTLGGVTVAAFGTWGVVATARRAGRTEKKTEEVQAQLLPNGGSSMRDAIDLANRRLTAHDERLERMEQAATRRGAQLDQIAEVVQAIYARQPGQEDS